MSTHCLSIVSDLKKGIFRPATVFLGPVGILWTGLPRSRESKAFTSGSYFFGFKTHDVYCFQLTILLMVNIVYFNFWYKVPSPVLKLKLRKEGRDDPSFWKNWVCSNLRMCMQTQKKSSKVF